MADLPAVRIVTTFVEDPSQTCAVCGGSYELLDTPIPIAYTVASIDADDPPVRVCDDCIERRYPSQVWDELRAERRRFERA